MPCSEYQLGKSSYNVFSISLKIILCTQVIVPYFFFQYRGLKFPAIILQKIQIFAFYRLPNI